VAASTYCGRAALRLGINGSLCSHQNGVKQSSRSQLITVQTICSDALHAEDPLRNGFFFACGQKNSLFHSFLRQKSENKHRLLLPNAVHTILSLQIYLGIKITVQKYACVGLRQIQSLSPCPHRQQKHKCRCMLAVQCAVLTKTMKCIKPLAAANGSVQALKRKILQREEILHDV
jgi:hypothetical protein